MFYIQIHICMSIDTYIYIDTTRALSICHMVRDDVLLCPRVDWMYTCFCCGNAQAISPSSRIINNLRVIELRRPKTRAKVNSVFCVFVFIRHTCRRYSQCVILWMKQLWIYASNYIKYIGISPPLFIGFEDTMWSGFYLASLTSINATFATLFVRASVLHRWNTKWICVVSINLETSVNPKLSRVQ